MASTEDYINAIRDRRQRKARVKVDFSALPEEVDSTQIAQELSTGLPKEYGEAIQSRLVNRKPVTITFSAIPEQPTIGQQVAGVAGTVVTPLAQGMKAVGESVAQ